jgi:PAS fold.
MNGIAIADLSGILTYVNPAFLSIWNYHHRDEVIGKSAITFWKNHDQAAEVIEAIKTAKQWQGEMEAERTDGSHAILLVSAHSILDESGTLRPLWHLSLILLIKKMAEQELIQANNIIEGMLNGIHDIVGLQLPNHSVVRYNKAGYEALGLSASEVVGKKCYELIGRDTPVSLCDQ